MNGRLKSNNFLREKHTANGELLVDLKTFDLLPGEGKKKKERIYEKIYYKNRFEQKSRT